MHSCHAESEMTLWHEPALEHVVAATVSVQLPSHERCWIWSCSWLRRSAGKGHFVLLLPCQTRFLFLHSPLLDCPLPTAGQSLESPGAPKKKKILSSLNSLELPNINSWSCWFVAKLCPTLAIPWTVVHQAPLPHGIFQASILDWVALFLLQWIFLIHISCIGRWILYHHTTWEALWRERERESISFPGDSVYLSDETLAALCSFLYPNRPGNATALEIVCLATLMPLATKSTGVALAGTSSNNQITALSQENTGCTTRLHEVSRPHKSRQTESRLVVARDWERGIQSEGRRRRAEMEGAW